MSSKKNVSILVGIIGVLILLLASSIGYIVYNEIEKPLVNTQISVDNSRVLKEIEELKGLYDSKIADKTNNYVALQIQKDSVENLVRALENSKTDASSLIKYKTQFKNLESKMKILVNEIVVLKSNKTKAIAKKEIPLIVASESKDNNENLVSKTEIVPIKKEVVQAKVEVNNTKNEAIVSKNTSDKEEAFKEKTEPNSKKNDKNVKVTLSDVKAGAYISKSATKKIPTNDAGRADVIKINFTIDGNPNASSGEKTYYFQILSNKNNVMGKRITEYFDSESLTYSFSKSFNYDSQSVQVSQEFVSATFEKGYYFVNIFDRDELVGKTSFLLK